MGARPTGREPIYLSPSDLVATRDGKQLFIACATARKVLVFDMEVGSVRDSIGVPDSPVGLTLSPDEKQLFVTCAAPKSTICIIDVASHRLTDKITAGHTAMAPVLSPDGKTLYVCNRFDNNVGVFDVATQKEIGQIPVEREPVAAALTPDGAFLFVVNHLHAGRADLDYVSTCVSVIDTKTRKMVKNIPLPSGSTMVRGICMSPKGDFACVTHIVGQFHVTTSQIERGWIANNAMSIIDVAQQSLFNTVLLDTIESGAATPWGVSWSADGRQICVTHAGTHEASVIDAPGLMQKLAFCASNSVVSVPQDLTFLGGLRQRIKLDQNGPRSLAISGSKAYIGNYFSDTLSVIDLTSPRAKPQTIELERFQPISTFRLGERNFNDATLCYQGWQSCASCHSSDARVDGLNWDLLNDGIGNPKNAKSLLLAYKTPPNMSLGIRANTEVAIRAGFSRVLFAIPSEETVVSVYNYLATLTPVPSPHLKNGELSKSAERGKILFSDPKVGCASCHNSEFYTNLKPYDVGTRNRTDRPKDLFYTPRLIEVWRTAPYLHDGSAATMRDLLTTCNKKDQHGITSHLTEQQIEDLAEFVLSL